MLEKKYLELEVDLKLEKILVKEMKKLVRGDSSMGSLNRPDTSAGHGDLPQP
jgi:hypothetical protein